MKNTTKVIAYEQDFGNLEVPEYYLMLPIGVERFKQTGVRIDKIKAPNDQVPELLDEKKTDMVAVGDFEEDELDVLCPKCGGKGHVKGHTKTTLHHCSFGSTPTKLEVNQKRFFCPYCHSTWTPILPFRAQAHRITEQAKNSIRDLLKLGFTLTEISAHTKIDRHIIKEIDKERLLEEYTEDNGTKLKKPQSYSPVIGIDEFLLHKGHQYATIIMDMKTGHILWVARGKKKQVVYDFIEHVGDQWMRHVEAVAMDMNSDFQEAFQDRYPHIAVVFDRFHLVKNFNEMVIANVRREEQLRLMAEGREEEAKKLKKVKFILTASRETLQEKDEKAKEGKVKKQGSELFNLPEVKCKGGHLEEKYDELIKENELLFCCDLVKEQLQDIYTIRDEKVLEERLRSTIKICRETDDVWFAKFANLLENHLDGIVSHARYAISSGKVEGTMNKIKTLRRKAYGYSDDEYFFLKIMDASRQERFRAMEKACVA